MSRNPDKMIERRSRILEVLKKDGHAMVTGLAQMFETTEVTIRSDLCALEKEKKLIRMAGGAVLPKEESEEDRSPKARELQHAPEKYAIAKYIAEEIHDGDTLFINSGSTTQYFAEALKGKKGLRIVTNALRVLAALSGNPGIHVVLIGGEVNTYDGFTYGLDAMETLKRYQAKYAVLSLDGITEDGTVSTFHAEEAEVSGAMIAHSEQTLLLADSSKLGKQGFFRLTEAGAGKTLVTDENANRNTVKSLQKSGMKVLMARL